MPAGWAQPPMPRGFALSLIILYLLFGPQLGLAGEEVPSRLLLGEKGFFLDKFQWQQEQLTLPEGCWAPADLAWAPEESRKGRAPAWALLLLQGWERAQMSAGSRDRAPVAPCQLLSRAASQKNPKIQKSPPAPHPSQSRGTVWCCCGPGPAANTMGWPGGGNFSGISPLPLLLLSAEPWKCSCTRLRV